MTQYIDQYITEVMNGFQSRNPDVLMEVSFRDGVYYFTIDYGFRFLPAGVQAAARKDINTVMQAVNKLKIQTELRLGEVQ